MNYRFGSSHFANTSTSKVELTLMIDSHTLEIKNNNIRLTIPRCSNDSLRY